MNVSFLAYRATLINVKHSKYEMEAKRELDNFDIFGFKCTH